MRRIIAVVSLLFMTVNFSGCAGLFHPTATVESPGALPLYSGPKARIAVADFEVKAAKAGGQIGSGLRDMLITALVNSNRFSVVERQALGAVMQEQELQSQSATQQPGGAQRGKIKTAELIITAAVTEFEPRVSGGRAGIGGGGGPSSGILGGLLGASLNKAHMALDIRVIDASTSEVIAATRVRGQASDIAGGFMAGVFGNGIMGGGLSAYANTPMEKAIRICIVEAVRYITQALPVNYYKY